MNSTESTPGIYIKDIKKGVPFFPNSFSNILRGEVEKRPYAQNPLKMSLIIVKYLAGYIYRLKWNRRFQTDFKGGVPRRG